MGGIKTTKHRSYMYLIGERSLTPYNEIKEGQTQVKYFLDGLLQAIIFKNPRK